MGLAERVVGSERFGSDVLVLSCDNDFAIGCEKVVSDGSGAPRVKYGVLDNIGGSSQLAHGHNSQCIDTKEWTSFSFPARSFFNDFIEKMPNPLLPLQEVFAEAYNSLADRVRVSPVKKPEVRSCLFTIGCTLSWPLAVLGTFSYLAAKSAVGKGEHGDNYLFMGVVLTPWNLKNAVLELVRPSVKGYKVLNPKVFDRVPDGVSPVVEFGYGDHDHSFFGDNSGYGFHFIFPDALKLSGSSAFVIPNPGENFYSGGKYFLPIDEDHKARVYDAVNKVDGVWQSFRDFRDKVDSSELTSILVDHNFIAN